MGMAENLTPLEAAKRHIEKQAARNEELEAVLSSAGIVRTTAGTYVAEYYVSESKVMQLPIDEWIAARKLAAERIATLEAIVREVRDLIEANGGGYDALASHHYDQLRAMLAKESTNGT